MTDSYRDLHGDAYSEWREEAAEEYVQAQRRAFLDGFEAAADESESFRLLREWLEEQRDEAAEMADEDRMMNVRRITFTEVLVKLHEMGCAPDSKEADDA